MTGPWRVPHGHRRRTVQYDHVMHGHVMKQLVRAGCPDRRRSTTMNAAVYESLVRQRVQDAHTQAREARLARALSASRRAVRAEQVARRAQERAVPVRG